MTAVLDASTSDGFVALLDGGAVRQVRLFPGGRSRGPGAAAALEEVVAGREISRIVVGTGPGSYNGLRSTIALAWGFAAARQIPLAGVSSLLGYPFPDYRITGDARQGQFFVASVSRGIFSSPPRLVPRDSLRTEFNHPGTLPIIVTGEAIVDIPGAVRATPDPQSLAAAATFAEAGEGGLPPLPAPIYLKPPHITRPRTPTNSRESEEKNFPVSSGISG